jgi:hypothetical protein
LEKGLEELSIKVFFSVISHFGRYTM